MARINIEDELFRDSRFLWLSDVVGGSMKALGMLVQFWVAAQRRWGHGELLPSEEFLPIWEPLLKVGFAQKKETGVYASGAEQHFAWYRQKVEAGKKRIKSKRNIHGQFTSGPPADHQRTLDESPADHQPPTPTPTPTLNKKEKCSFDFSEVYKKYPQKKGKTAGLATLKKTIRTNQEFEEFEKAVRNYAAEYSRPLSPGEFRPEPKHFSTFCSKGNWRDWIETPEAFGSISPTQVLRGI